MCLFKNFAPLSSRRYYNGATGGALAVSSGAGGAEERVTYIYGPDGLVALLSGAIEASAGHPSPRWR